MLTVLVVKGIEEFFEENRWLGFDFEGIIALLILLILSIFTIVIDVILLPIEVIVGLIYFIIKVLEK